MHMPVLAVLTVIMAVTGQDVLSQGGVIFEGTARLVMGVQNRGWTTPQAEA